MRGLPSLASNPIRRLLAHLQDPLYRNGYALTLSSATNSLLGFFYWILAARYYPAEVVGIGTATIAAMMLLSGLSIIYLDGTLVRFVPVAGRVTRRLVLTVYAILTMTGALIGSVFLLGVSFWSPALLFLRDNLWLGGGFVGAIIIWSIFNVQDGVLIGMRKAILIPLENACYALLKLLLLIAFAALLPTYGIFLSWVAPLPLLIVVVNYLLFSRLFAIHAQATESIARSIRSADLVRYAAGNYFGTVCSLATTMLPPLMVLQISGNRASAYFYMPWVMANLFRVLATDTSTAMVVEGVTNPHKLPELFRSALLNTARVVIPAMILCFIAAPFILRFFGADYATEGSVLLQLLALAAIPNIVVTLYFGWLRAQNRIWTLAGLQLLVAAAFLGCSYSWLQQYGITGIGIAMLSVQTIAAFLLLVFQLRFILQKQSPRVVVG